MRLTIIINLFIVALVVYLAITKTPNSTADNNNFKDFGEISCPVPLIGDKHLCAINVEDVRCYFTHVEGGNSISCIKVGK